MSATDTRPWVHEHGRQFDVPDAIAALEGVDDLSWHNDTCPSFGRSWDHGGITVRVWCEHPDPDERENPDWRYVVSAEGMWDERGMAILLSAGLDGEREEGVDVVTVLNTDDERAAAAALVVTIAKVHLAIERDRKPRA